MSKTKIAARKSDQKIDPALRCQFTEYSATFDSWKSRIENHAGAEPGLQQISPLD